MKCWSSKPADFLGKASKVATGVAISSFFGFWFLQQSQQHGEGDTYRVAAHLSQAFKWAAITCVVVSAQVNTGRASQSGIQRVLGTIAGGSLGFAVVLFAFYTDLHSQVIFMALSSAAAAFIGFWVGWVFSLDISAKLFGLTYMLVVFGAHSDSSAAAITLTRISGICLGVVISLLMQMVIYPQSASDQAVQKMHEALRRLCQLNTLAWAQAELASDPQALKRALERPAKVGNTRRRIRRALWPQTTEAGNAGSRFGMSRKDASPCNEAALQQPLLEPSADGDDLELALPAGDKEGALDPEELDLKAEKAISRVYKALDNCEKLLPFAKSETLCRRGQWWCYMPGCLWLHCSSWGLPEQQIKQTAMSIRRVARLLWTLHITFSDGFDEHMLAVLAHQYPHELFRQLIKASKNLTKDLRQAFPNCADVPSKNLEQFRMSVGAVICVSDYQRRRVIQVLKKYKQQAAQRRRLSLNGRSAGQMDSRPTSSSDSSFGNGRIPDICPPLIPAHMDRTTDLGDAIQGDGGRGAKGDHTCVSTAPARPASPAPVGLTASKSERSLPIPITSQFDPVAWTSPVASAHLAPSHGCASFLSAITPGASPSQALMHLPPGIIITTASVTSSLESHAPRLLSTSFMHQGPVQHHMASPNVSLLRAASSSSSHDALTHSLNLAPSGHLHTYDSATLVPAMSSVDLRQLGGKEHASHATSTAQQQKGTNVSPAVQGAQYQNHMLADSAPSSTSNAGGGSMRAGPGLSGVTGCPLSNGDGSHVSRLATGEPPLYACSVNDCGCAAQGHHNLPCPVQCAHLLMACGHDPAGSASWSEAGDTRQHGREPCGCKICGTMSLGHNSTAMDESLGGEAATHTVDGQDGDVGAKHVQECSTCGGVEHAGCSSAETLGERAENNTLYATISDVRTPNNVYENVLTRQPLIRGAQHVCGCMGHHCECLCCHPHGKQLRGECRGNATSAASKGSHMLCRPGHGPHPSATGEPRPDIRYRPGAVGAEARTAGTSCTMCAAPHISGALRAADTEAGTADIPSAGDAAACLAGITSADNSAAGMPSAVDAAACMAGITCPAHAGASTANTGMRAAENGVLAPRAASADAAGACMTGITSAHNLTACTGGIISADSIAACSAGITSADEAAVCTAGITSADETTTCAAGITSAAETAACTAGITSPDEAAACTAGITSAVEAAAWMTGVPSATAVISTQATATLQNQQPHIGDTTEEGQAGVEDAQQGGPEDGQQKGRKKNKQPAALHPEIRFQVPKMDMTAVQMLMFPETADGHLAKARWYSFQLVLEELAEELGTLHIHLRELIPCLPHSSLGRQKKDQRQGKKGNNKQKD